jgi:hypothetical protein
MVDGQADDLGKRKADAANLDEPSESAGRTKRLRSQASGRDVNSAEQPEHGILASVENDTIAGARAAIEFDSEQR